MSEQKTDQGQQGEEAPAFVITQEQFEFITGMSSAAISACSSVVNLLLKEGVLDAQRAVDHFRHDASTINPKVPPHHQMHIAGALELLRTSAMKYVPATAATTPRDQKLQ